MGQENTTEEFERGIEEIEKGSDSKNSMPKPKNEQYPKNKSERFKDIKKHNKYKKNVNYQKFRDNDIREQKDSEPKPIKSSPGSLGATSELARKKLSEVLNKKVESVVSISKQEGGWVAELEVIDEEYLPEIELKSMNDIIGLYEVQLDDKGELTGWSKKSSRKRGEIH